MSIEDGGAIHQKDQLRLIVHVGMGKTGTTSIQDSLRFHQDELKAQGYLYLGLMLEYAPVIKYEWQDRNAAAFGPFPQGCNKLQRISEMKDVVTETIAVMKQNGWHTAIWSNEAFFETTEDFRAFLVRLKEEGVSVELIAYVRRHDGWAKSAYVQWGLKHKTYTGPVLSFNEYVKKRPVRFAETLRRWSDAFQNAFIIRNFDQAGDSVQDFTAAIGFPGVLPSRRVNESPSSEELLLRAIFHNTLSEQALPAVFDKMFEARSIDFSLRPTGWMNSLLPNEQDLRRLVEEVSEDLGEVNVLLEKAGQPLLGGEVKAVTPATVDNDVLLGVMIQLLVRQNKKIDELQRELRALANPCNGDSLTKAILN